MMLLTLGRNLIGVNPKAGLTYLIKLLKAYDVPFSIKYVEKAADVPDLDLFVVREPGARVVSMFTMLAKHVVLGVEKITTLDAITAFAESATIDALTFRDFVRYLIETPPPGRDIHHRNQLIPRACRIVLGTHELNDRLDATLLKLEIIEQVIGFSNEEKRKMSNRSASDQENYDGQDCSIMTIAKLNQAVVLPSLFPYPKKENLLMADLQSTINKLFQEELEFYTSNFCTA